GIINIEAMRTDDAADPNNGSLSAIQNRKIFSVANLSAQLFRIEADGDIGIGPLTTDSGIISYDDSGNIFAFDTDTTSNVDISFFTNDLYLDKSEGHIGVGTTTTEARLDIAYGGMSLLRGADSNAETRTNSTSKISRLGSYHY